MSAVPTGSTERRDEEKGVGDVDVPVKGDWGLRDIKTRPSWRETVGHIYASTSWSNPSAWLHILLLVIPVAWVSHFIQWYHNTTFVLCFVAMIPLQKLFDWGGENLGEYLGKDLKDLLVITLSNAIEAALAVILLLKCELRLLQSTLIGVVLLHLLLVPGTAFFAQGAQMHEQRLDPNHNSLNHSLSMIGVLGILVPTVFFAALDRGDVTNPTVASGLPSAFVPLVSDAVRKYILQISRGIAIILPVVYVTSRLWRHRVLPGHDQDLSTSSNPSTNASAPPALNAAGSERGPSIVKSTGPSGTAARVSRASMDTTVAEDDVNDKQIRHERGQSASEDTTGSQHTRAINPWFCVCLILTAVGLMIPTAEFLVSSIEDVRESSGIQTEWFGLILLPILSFSADGVVVLWKLSNKSFQQYVLRKQGDDGTAEESQYEAEFAHWRPIDLSVQFMLWWTPFLVLLGWWTGRPMHLLFDYFEVALLLGACFLVNYVTVDAKTNVSEGLTMISYYAMIATATWFYPGQPQVLYMLHCPGTVAEAVAMGAEPMLS